MSDLNNLVKEFFLGLKCKVSGDKILSVENVPNEFERLYGKKSPYRFSFISNVADKDVEFVTKSGHLLKSISEYLKNKAKTTILRLDISKDVKEDLLKHLKLNGSSIIRIDKTTKYDYILKLTFETTLQYLNENERIINNIYVHEGVVINNFDIDDYPTVRGDRKDVLLGDLKSEINSAKSAVSSLLRPRIEEISKRLVGSLKEGLKRIDSHYGELYEELNQQVRVNLNKIEELKKEEDEFADKKIKKIEETIQKLNERVNPAEAEREKNFHVNDEKHKHTLSVSSALLNKTIIYYPIYSLVVYFDFSKKIRQSSFEFNPLTKQIKRLLCDSCKKEMRSLRLCSSNHLICDSCFRRCGSCGQVVCLECRKDSCIVCDREMCRGCSNLCFKCKKYFCSTHIRRDSKNNSNICVNCSEICSNCGAVFDKSMLKKHGYKVLCSKCLSKGFIV